jgi:hypothetical protein
MLNNDILKHTLSTLSMRDIVRFSAISKQIRAQVISLPYKYNVKSGDVFAITMHKMHNKRFLTVATRRYYINRGIMEHNYALIREFASVRPATYEELLDIAFGDSPDKLRILHHYVHNVENIKIKLDTEYITLLNAYYIIKRKFNRVRYNKQKYMNALLLCANCTDAEIRASPTFRTNMVKTALFQYARKELYCELTKFSVIGIPVLFNCESIDESVKCEYYDAEKLEFVENSTNTIIMKVIKNAKLNQKSIINVLQYDIKYIIYILDKYNQDYILSLQLPYSAEIITNALINNYDIENLRKLSEINTLYAPNYEKLRNQMISYGML